MSFYLPLGLYILYGGKCIKNWGGVGKAPWDVMGLPTAWVNYFSTMILIPLAFTFSLKVMREGGLYLTLGAAPLPQAWSSTTQEAQICLGHGAQGCLGNRKGASSGCGTELALHSPGPRAVLGSRKDAFPCPLPPGGGWVVLCLVGEWAGAPCTVL